MKNTISALFTKSTVCGVCFSIVAFATSIVVLEASANSRTNNSVFIETGVDGSIEANQKVYCQLANAEKSQNGSSPVTTQLTLQNIHRIKNRNIYGSELMTNAELAKFREDLKQCKTTDELELFLSAHRMRMKARAAERGVVLSDD